MSVGASGTGGGSRQGEIWDYNVIKKLPTGTYNLIISIPQSVKNEIAGRKDSGKAYKRFSNNCRGLGTFFLEDIGWMKEVMNEGLDKYLERQ